VITIQTALLVGLGFLLASLLVVLLTPAYRARTVRLATDRVRAQLPVTEQELKADKDRIRAENALRVHRLETQLEQFKFGAARQLVEVSRRDGLINTLGTHVEQLKGEFEAAQNARNVLEQTVADRLPKVEQRLIEAKKLLFQRDRDISALNDEAARTQRALVEAVQINAQQRSDIDRLSMIIETRAAQNRDGLADPTFDAEVAMKSEIEALRGRTRDQASVISRLQSDFGREPAALPAAAALVAEGYQPIPEVVRLQRDVLPTEAGNIGRAEYGPGSLAGNVAHNTELRLRDQKIEDLGQDIARLEAALATYQDTGGTGDRASFLKDSKIAMKARSSSLQAQVDAQSETVRKLRAEVAASNEQLARQAQHFMDEMRRLGAGTLPAAVPLRRQPATVDRKSQSLSQRISDAKANLGASLNGSARPTLVKAASNDTADEVVTPVEAVVELATDANGPGAARSRSVDRITDYGKV
jgi:hypothetical protein